MAYIAQSDIEDLFGATNVATWSNVEGNSREADATRIAKAIEYAEDHINDRFRGSRYAVPLTATRKVKHWAAAHAGAWLYRSRGVAEETNPVETVAAEVERDIDAYLSGQRTLASAETHSDRPTAPVVVG